MKLKTRSMARWPAWVGILAAWISWQLTAATIPVALSDNTIQGTFTSSSDSNTYTFSVPAGQMIFYRPITADAAFNGNLSYQLFDPSGTRVRDEYFLTRRDRLVLEKAGTYSLKVYVYNPKPAFVGNYAFQLRAVPPDDQFVIRIGDTVNESTPGGGSGRIRGLGYEQDYTFAGVAGQNVIVEDLSADPSFDGSLAWVLYDPSNGQLFDNYLNGSLRPGRLTLQKTGNYRIRVYVYASDSPAKIGAYSFRITELPADVTYPIPTTITVSDGVPAAGAGRISRLGEQDFYTFTGFQGQNIVFEDLTSDPAFKGRMSWTLYDPDGGVIFDQYISNTLRPGRKTLTKTGTYRIKAYVYTSKDPTEVGAYSFRLTSEDADKSFPIVIGQVISDGVPAVGAGRIASRTEEDFYTFQGKAGQVVVFEDLQSAATFTGRLAWTLKDPAGDLVFDKYLNNARLPGPVTLPLTGQYSLRVYVYNSTDPTQVGTYSFRSYIRVLPRNDRLATLPGTAVEVPLTKILFNDLYAEGDSPTIDLPSPNSVNGGTVTRTATGLRYVPVTGFQGVDQFTYRLSGSAGGVATAQVNVYVASDASTFATVVGSVRGATNLLNLCLYGQPNTNYQLESSPDFTNWTPGSTLVTDATGGALSSLAEIPGVPRYYLRFRRK